MIVHDFFNKFMIQHEYIDLIQHVSYEDIGVCVMMLVGVERISCLFLVFLNLLEDREADGIVGKGGDFKALFSE